MTHAATMQRQVLALVAAHPGKAVSGLHALTAPLKLDTLCHTLRILKRDGKLETYQDLDEVHGKICTRYRVAP